MLCTPVYVPDIVVPPNYRNRTMFSDAMITWLPDAVVGANGDRGAFALSCGGQPVLFVQTIPVAAKWANVMAGTLSVESLTKGNRVCWMFPTHSRIFSL
jgi:hypothetical protein